MELSDNVIGKDESANLQHLRKALTITNWTKKAIWIKKLPDITSETFFKVL